MRNQPFRLPIFGAAAALLVGRRSMKDILPPRASQQPQISGNAPVPHFVIAKTNSEPIARGGFDQRLYLACMSRVPFFR